MLFTTRFAGGRGGCNVFQYQQARLGVLQKNSSPANEWSVPSARAVSDLPDAPPRLIPSVGEGTYMRDHGLAKGFELRRSGAPRGPKF